MQRTQVVIIGAGPSGLMLSLLLQRHGVSSIVLERQSRAYVEARIRAGLLEWDTVELLEQAGIGPRMRREGLVHDGFELAFAGRHLQTLPSRPQASRLVRALTMLNTMAGPRR